VLSPADAGLPEAHPTTTEVQVELDDVDGHTRLVMTHVGVASDSEGAAGWAMALDKLATHAGAQMRA
jgi:Activator of Hsp90 ATPase homolog 1-like protein